jgi:hypothetical protein
MNTLLHITSIFIFILFESFLIKNELIINIYKNPIFKLIFLFEIYIYGEKDIILTLLFSLYYVYLGQKIEEKELLLTVKN